MGLRHLALYAVYLQISLGGRIDSDGANSALQAWDLIHGHLLLHGWLIGDATYYSFELPINGITQLIFGLGPLAAHVASALVYFIVTACAVALAVAGSRGGPARVARSAVTVTVLAFAPLLTMLTVWTLIEGSRSSGYLGLHLDPRPASGPAAGFIAAAAGALVGSASGLPDPGGRGAGRCHRDLRRGTSHRADLRLSRGRRAAVAVR